MKRKSLEVQRKIYELIKSFAGEEYFDLTLHQIASYRNMSYGKAQESFKKLIDAGIIKMSKETSYFEGDEYQIVDEWLAYKLDPDFEYNKNRTNILNSKPKR